MSAFHDLFFHLLIASRDAAILALAIGGVLLLAGNRLSPKWRHWLWLLVAVRLLAPVLPESPFSWQAWLPEPTALSPAPIPFESTADGGESWSQAAPDGEAAGESPAITAAPTQGTSLSPSAPLSLYSIILLTWATGAVAGIGLLVLGWTRFHHAIRRTQRPESAFARRLVEKTAQLASAWGMKPPRVVVSPAVHTPSVTGVFRKTFLFPSGFGENLEDAQLDYVILHELGHLKRRDTLVQWLLCLLRIVHWFNPVIWWAFRRIQMESERATDELVIRRTSVADRRAYGDTLLRLVELSSQFRRVPGLVGVAENPGDIKSRLVAIARFRERKAWQSALVSTLILAGLATVGLTQAPSGSDTNWTPAECRLIAVVRRTIAVPFDSTLTRSFVIPGDAVTKEQVLAELDGREIRIKLAEAVATCSVAKKRCDHLMVHGSPSALQVANLEVERCNLEVQRLHYQIDNLLIRSPIDGVVLQGNLTRSVGVPVREGQKLFAIAPLDRMLAEIAIPEDKIRLVKAGARVQIRLDSDSSRAWDTTIERIRPVSEIWDGKNMFIAEATLNNEGETLRPGMRGTVRIMAPTGSSSPDVEEDRGTAQAEARQWVKKFTGYLEPWRSVTVTWSEAEGSLEIHAEEGAEVRKGDPVASQDTSVLERQLGIVKVEAQSNAAIAIASAGHMVAVQRWEMLNRLQKQGTASATELLRAEAEVERSQAQLDRAREEKSIAELRVTEFEARISQKTLRSPIDGVVVAINHDTDLRSNEAREKKASLVRIAQVDKLALVMSLTVGRIGDLKTGDDIRVVISRAGAPDTEAKGRLEFLSPEVDQESGNIRVRISVPNEEGKLRSGSPASILLPVPPD